MPPQPQAASPGEKPHAVPLGAARIRVALPEGASPWPIPYQPNLVPSPDGKSIVFAAKTGVKQLQVLWVQRLDSPVAQRLDQTDGGRLPFWSPDGKWIAFFTANEIMRVPADGGSVQRICASTGGQGATWGPDGTIVFDGRDGLQRVHAADGTPAPLTPAAGTRGESQQMWPQFLPDGRHFLYWEGKTASADPAAAMYVGELGTPRRTRVIQTPYRAIYASGYLLFTRMGMLYAQPFDPDRLQLRGEPALVAPYVNTGQGRAAFSASANGVLAYRADEVPAALYRMTWYDRAGRVLGTLRDWGEYSNPALSSDGHWLAVSVGKAQLNRDIFLFDLVRGTEHRMTSDTSDDYNPVWAPDGQRILFSSTRLGQRDLFTKNPFSTAPEQLLLQAKSGEEASAEDWSRDGRSVAFNTGGSLSVLPLDTKQPFLFAALGSQARFSPDGKMLAYHSGTEVYVQPFPPTGARQQISTRGGWEPKWRSDGRELYYGVRGTPPKLMAVDIIGTKDGALLAGRPHELFNLPEEGAGHRDMWLVTPDGQKFVVLVPQDQKPVVTSLVIVHNWTALVAKQ